MSVDSVTRIGNASEPDVKSSGKIDLLDPEFYYLKVIIEKHGFFFLGSDCKIVLTFFKVPFGLIHVFQLGYLIQTHDVIRAVRELICGFVRNEFAFDGIQIDVSWVV
jgi:hypothetical protein